MKTTNEKLTEAQRRQLRSLAGTVSGKSYALRGMVRGARLKTWANLQRKGLVRFDEERLCANTIVEITDAGRAALKEGGS